MKASPHTRGVFSKARGRQLEPGMCSDLVEGAEDPAMEPATAEGQETGWRK